MSCVWPVWLCAECTASSYLLALLKEALMHLGPPMLSFWGDTREKLGFTGLATFMGSLLIWSFNVIFVVSRQCTLVRSKLVHAQSVCSLILSKIIQYSIECGWHWVNVRSVKRETLKLIETFVDKAEDTDLIAKQFVPAMMDPILGDYARNVSDARESEVLSLFATIINKYVCLPWPHVHIFSWALLSTLKYGGMWCSTWCLEDCWLIYPNCHAGWRELCWRMYHKFLRQCLHVPLRCVDCKIHQ